MQTILITGGTGYIGSHTCLNLIEKNFRVIIIDSLINSSFKSIISIKKILKDKYPDIDKRLFFFEGDIRNESFLKSIFNKFTTTDSKIESVIHFAGLKSVSESVSNPLSYWEVNVYGSITLFKVMDFFNCNEIVFSSSANVYDPSYKGKLDENAPLKPINPYGQSKLTIEEILKNMYSSNVSKWKIAILRYFNPIGAHFSGELGENPVKKPSNLFPLLTEVGFNELDLLRIYGKDWPTRDGTGIRDFLHIMDLSEAHTAALYYIKENKPNINIFNIGTGKGTTVLELIKIFEKVNNCSINYKFSPRRDGDISQSIADISKALFYLNWKPLLSIENACKDSWRWIAKNPKGYIK